MKSQGDLKEPPLPRPNQGISSAAGADVDSVVGRGVPNSTEPTTLTPHLCMAELLVSGLSRGDDFYSDPHTQDPACPTHLCPSAKQCLVASSGVAWKGSSENRRKMT